jgi:hypothetical protein
MAGLASLLSDPNYTGANDATKQAIFDKFAPQDPNFTGANPETQLAIRSKFGLVAAPSGGIPVGRGVGQIPTEPGANLTPTVEQPRSMFQRAMGNLETIPALAAGAVGGAVAPIAGVIGTLTSGKYGTQEGIRAGEAAAQQMQSQFYQPRTPEAQRNLTALGEATAPLIGVPLGTMADFSRGAGAGIRAAKDLTRDVVGAALPFGETTASQAARLSQERIAQSVQNAAKIEAAQSANKLGIALNPATSNPTKANKLRSMVAGNQDLNVKLAEANNPKWTDLVKKDIGVEPGQVLDAKAIDSALEKHSAPYNVVATIPTLAPDAAVIDSIKSLVQRPTIGGESVAAAINGLVDDAVTKVSAGRSGADVVRDIRQLRRDANNTYKSQSSGGVPSPEAIAEANTRVSIANSLEQLIDANVTDPKLLGEIRKSRAAQAKIFDVERATNFATNKVDPQVFARMVSEGKPLSGVPAEIGKIAANFPEIAGVAPTVANLQPRLTRSGIGGTIGALAGLTVGQPYAGAAIGAGAGALTSAAAAKRIGTPSYQAARAVPTDYRPPVNALRPVEPNLTPNGLVPYDYSQAAFTPPNFVIPQAPLREAPLMSSPMARELPAPAAGGPMAGFRAEEARAGAMSRTLGQQAEADAAAAQAAGRQPTRGGTPMVFDEQGKLIPADQTLRGATPNIQVIESTGKSLSGAADILASGRSPALMSAEQKIAWEKTKVDLADIVPGMRALNDKAIASKMLDRAWVEGAITKAREKAAAFDEMSKRATGAQAIRDAVINREKMLDAAEMLQEQLGSRPVSSGSQGPKTQAAQRNKNAIRPTDVEIKNALIGR